MRGDDEPRHTCLTCGRTRRCLLHWRAAFPPDAAKTWLQAHCRRPERGCAIQYAAGALWRVERRRGARPRPGGAPVQLSADAACVVAGPPHNDVAGAPPRHGQQEEG